MHCPRLLFLAALCVLAAQACVEETPPPSTAVPVRQPTIVRPALASPVASPAPIVVAAPTPSPTARVQTYTVEEGDTLSSIAARVYGDANLWQRIFEANRDQLTSADQLTVGQSLRIPPPS